MALLFENAAKAKNAIVASQQKEIAKLYDDWANDIADRAKFYSHKTNASAPLSERYYKELYSQMKATSQMVSDEIAGIIKGNMYTIADSVVADNVKWLQSFGFSEDGLNAAFSYVPHDVVQMLVTGQVYQGGWNLSQRIWSDNQQMQKDIYQIMARGLAENKSIYNIAKDLESYVKPGAAKAWNPILAMRNTKTGEIEYKRIYKSQVDYNAQRLARTLAQHTYQQSFIATTKDNPFITEYIWHSNGSRVCPLCADRDGKHFKKDELPMDHPNGMCTMEPAVAEDMVDQLADWFNSPDGTYPEIDAFAGNFGYEAKAVKSVTDFVNKYGMSTKSPSAWFNSLNQIQKAEAKALKDASGLNWNEWYEQNIHSSGNPNLDFVKKYGTSTKSPNAWFSSLTPEQKAEAKLLKEQSGLTWNKWYEQYVYAGGTNQATAKVVQTAAQSVDDVLAAAKAKLGSIPNKTYSGIWKDDVTLADYESKAGSIVAKKQYYADQIAKLGNSVDDLAKKAKFQGYLDDLAEFEKNGKLYMQAQQEVKAAQMAFNQAKGIQGKFTPDMYTDEAKAAAKSFTSADAADKFHRKYLDSIWNEGTEYEHYSVWEYTQNSNPINKSLSGYHDDWSRSSFKGLGKTDLGHEDNWRSFDTKTFDKKFGVNGHKDYKSVVQSLTTMIDKSELPDSVYLVRGSDKNGLAGLLEGNLLSFDDAKSLLNSGDVGKIKSALEGQVFTNHSYMSTGIAKGTGFSGEVSYEVFAPKGTHAIYAEPASYYGNTVGMKEKLYKVGQSYSSIGREAEVIIQRGTDFRITDVAVDGRGHISIKMEIVNQPDYFKTGLEHTHNGGKTSYKK